jgi:hypothetical protein
LGTFTPLQDDEEDGPGDETQDAEELGIGQA